jgi:hypothetical protein
MCLIVTATYPRDAAPQRHWQLLAYVPVQSFVMFPCDRRDDSILPEAPVVVYSIGVVLVDVVRVIHLSGPHVVYSE